MEQTLVIIKPGAVQRGLIGTVISRFEQKGLRLAKEWPPVMSRPSMSGI